METPLKHLKSLTYLLARLGTARFQKGCCSKVARKSGIRTIHCFQARVSTTNTSCTSWNPPNQKRNGKSWHPFAGGPRRQGKPAHPTSHLPRSATSATPRLGDRGHHRDVGRGNFRVVLCRPGAQRGPCKGGRGGRGSGGVVVAPARHVLSQRIRPVSGSKKNRKAAAGDGDGPGEMGSSTISAKPGIEPTQGRPPQNFWRGAGPNFPIFPGCPTSCRTGRTKHLLQGTTPTKTYIFCFLVVFPFWKHEVFRFSNLQEIPPTFLLFAVGVVLISTGDFLGAESRWL